MEQLVCKACGAPLERDGHCSYCGSRYNVEYNSGPRPMLIEVEHPRVRRIVAETRVDKRYLIDEDCFRAVDLGRFTRHRLSEQLADSLYDAMKITMKNDPFEETIIVRGELRVVDPDFRF